MQVCAMDTSAWAEQIQEQPTHAPSVQADPDTMAFMIFTSGTTGRPKGVMVPHRGLANNILHSKEILKWGTQDMVWQRTSVSFDVHLMDTWMAWACASCLVPAHADANFSPQLALDQVKHSFS